MTTKSNPKSRQKDLVTQELGNETLIYNLKTDKAYCLNETSALVWQLCDGQRSVAEISQAMSRKLKTSVTEDLVWLAIDQLKEDNLLEDAGEVSARFEGLSRRAVIRRVGLASLVTLPVISSLIAPTAAHAQSGNAGAGQACTASCTGGLMTDSCARGCCEADASRCAPIPGGGPGDISCPGVCTTQVADCGFAC